METSPQDGFEEARRRILAAALQTAAFDGWTPMMMRAAAAKSGVEPAALAAAFPGGVADLLTFWSETLDRETTLAMNGPDFKALKIRQKVAFAVRRRLDAMARHKEAARRAAATLALPLFAPLATRLVWRTADGIWRAMGDASTDFNFYSKRAILSGVLASTLARWLSDDSVDEEATNAFLAARIKNVMEIEKLKARIREGGIDLEKPVKWLAGLRYKG